MSTPLELRLNAVRYAAKETLAFELVAPDGSHLPPAEAGAHIGVHLPAGMVRQYSLVHASERMARYEIAVKRDPRSRGGSRFMHESLRVGSLLAVDPPRNNFPLAPHAPASLFFAGGIGVTPIVAMIEQLAAAGRPAQLYYACREREELAFLPELSRLCAPVVHIDAEHGGAVLDLAAPIAAAPRDAHLYCCGPAPMLAAFDAATRDWPRAQVHVEYFTPREAPSIAGGFTVTLARSGRELAIPAGRRILEVLRDAGLTPTCSCEEGVCGACETRVLEGIPDHRDSILSPDERAANRTMMICVSGSRTSRLVLDL